MAEEFKFVLSTDLDESGIDAKLAKIKDKIKNSTSTTPIKLTLDASDVTSQLNSIKKQIQGLSNIKINLSGTGTTGGTGSATGDAKRTVSNLQATYQQMLAIQKKIGSLKIRIGGLNGSANSNELAVLRQQLQDLESEYTRVQSKLGQDNLSTEQWNRINAVIENTNQRLAQLDAKVADTKAKLAGEITTKFDKSVATDTERVATALDKVKQKSAETADAMQRFNNAIAQMNAAKQSGDVDKIRASYDEYRAALKNVEQQIRQNQQAERDNIDATQLQAQKNAFALQMDVWLRNNSAAARQFGGQIEQLKIELQSCDATRFNGIKAEFQEITRQAELAGQATLSFGDRLKNQFAKLGTYLSAATLISYSVRAIRSMYNNVVEVDTAMTELYRVTDLTTEHYDALYSSMISSAKEYGVALNDIIDSTASWVRLGFDADLSERLAEITAMYQHVTDLDNATAVNNLVTAYKGFQTQLESMFNGDSAAAIEYVADIYDKLGNEFAESAADVGDGLSKAASVLAVGGNSIQESVAMFTGIQEVLQDSGVAGAALKILTLRLRGMKGELQELGEDVDENVESISKMQTQILNFTHGHVNIFNDDGTFKSTYEIMSDIAEIYDELSDTDKASLLETIAGKNRANAVQALIDNWSQVEKAAMAAENAQGTAAEENAKYMNSLQGHLDTLKASWQALSNTILSSDFLRGLLEGLTGFINGLDTVIEKIGVLPTLIGSITAVQSFRNVGELNKQFHYQITL